jgi:hypothetical protein
VHAGHETLTLAHPSLPWLILLARCECLKRHGVGGREGELGADFSRIVLPSVCRVYGFTSNDTSKLDAYSGSRTDFSAAALSLPS